MPATLLRIAIAAMIVVLPVAQGRAQRNTFDFTAVDQFWRMHDKLVRDVEPTEKEWTALLSTPGYTLAQSAMGVVIREDLELAFKPERAAERARLDQNAEGRGSRVAHLREAERTREALTALRDSLAASRALDEAVARAQKYLPPGVTQRFAPPPVSFALFRDDAFSQPAGIVVDLMNAHGSILVPILAHEFHHSFIYHISPGAPADLSHLLSLPERLYLLRMEGIADQIDKHYPFHGWSPETNAYASAYNAHYESAASLMPRLDSLLAVVAHDPSAEARVNGELVGLLWSNGHPLGAYIARTIIDTFGPDSILPGTRSPAAFLRTFAAAERVHGRKNPLSPGSRRLLDSLESRYWK